MSSFLASFHNIPITLLENSMTNYRCIDAVRHLFRVASGVESMVFGEHEILGQIRDAYFLCLDKKTTGTYLNRLFQQAIATGKEVRNRTVAGRGALSIASIAVERIEEIIGDLSTKRLLVVGAGTMGFRAMKRLAALHPRTLALANRTDERAARICSRFNAKHLQFDKISRMLPAFDVIVLATSSSRYILEPNHITAHKYPASHSLLVVDLGAPRNADPAIASLSTVTLVCIDDLRHTAETRLDERKSELAVIEDIIEQQVAEFTRWYTYKSGCVCKQI
jgi:glutamyl-tRNA reductase